MARYKDRDKAIALRRDGMSYTQIKSIIPVSKSTLSLWLRGMPLPAERIRELRDFSEQRIEKTRETKRRKKIARITNVYKIVTKEIGKLSQRELFIAGLFLYWGEGMKADPYVVMFTNTDPAMVRCFVSWIKLFGVKATNLKAYLHLYDDMDEKERVKFWSQQTSIPPSSFRKSYIKKTTKDKRVNYKGRFGHGTCNVYIIKRDVREKIGMGIERLRELYGGVAFDASKAV